MSGDPGYSCRMPFLPETQSQLPGDLLGMWQPPRHRHRSGARPLTLLPSAGPACLPSPALGPGWDPDRPSSDVHRLRPSLDPLCRNRRRAPAHSRVLLRVERAKGLSAPAYDVRPARGDYLCRDPALGNLLRNGDHHLAGGAGRFRSDARGEHGCGVDRDDRERPTRLRYRGPRVAAPPLWGIRGRDRGGRGAAPDPTARLAAAVWTRLDSVHLIREPPERGRGRCTVRVVSLGVSANSQRAEPTRTALARRRASPRCFDLSRLSPPGPSGLQGDCPDEPTVLLDRRRDGWVAPVRTPTPRAFEQTGGV